jgi:hypothetical protein
MPFATAPEFCSVSPCDHARVAGAADDFVGIWISGPRTGAEKVKAVGVDMVPTLPFTLTSTIVGLDALISKICSCTLVPTLMYCPTDKSIALVQTNWLDVEVVSQVVAPPLGVPVVPDWYTTSRA